MTPPTYKATEIIDFLATPTVTNADELITNPFWAITQQKELIDSMHSASYIQQSIFGLPRDFENKIEFDCFLMHTPKDIVSGDFYWSYKILDKLIIMVGDCTGHGIPGALLTIFAHSALYKAVAEARITDPGKILSTVSACFSETFKLKRSITGIGMDATICTIDTNKMQLEFAGAGNSLWITRKNELIELRGDRFSVGSNNTHAEFSTQHYNLQKNDNIYLFTDGYEDQFGGEPLAHAGGKKFLRKRFKQVVLEMHDQPMNKQKNGLVRVMDNWKKDFEQVDDICVLGVKI